MELVGVYNYLIIADASHYKGVSQKHQYSRLIGQLFHDNVKR
ncbi:unnamed protein product [Acidithrix sp. C25]|nr:unnamed protein product [Acidithrix sp. C25]